MAGPEIRLLIVDDHGLLRDGLALVLASAPDIAVVGAAGSAVEARTLAVEQRPNLVVLDMDLGADDGLAFLPALFDVAPQAKTLVLTDVKTPERHRDALLRGARGLVLKEQRSDILLRAVRRVHAGELWFDRGLVDSVLQRTLRPDVLDPVQAKIASLTRREREVVTFVADGLKNREIARRLRISEKTARNHLSAIFQKLAIEDRVRLLMFAYRHGLARPPVAPS